MYRTFFSWLQLKDYPFIKAELPVIKKIANDLNLKFEEQDFKIHTENNDGFVNYSYLTSEENFNEKIKSDNTDLFLVHYLKNTLYINFVHAIENILRYYPKSDFVSFDEIKGLNILDRIFVPTKETKTFLENNHIDSEKIFFLPFPVLESNCIENSDQNIVFATCSFKNNSWKELINAFGIIENKYSDIKFYLYIKTDEETTFQNCYSEILRYYHENSFSFKIEVQSVENFELKLTKGKIVYLELIADFQASLRIIEAISKNIITLSVKNIFFEYSDKFTLKHDISKEITNVMENFDICIQKFKHIFEEVKKTYSIDNFELKLKNYLEETYQRFSKNRKLICNSNNLGNGENHKIEEIITQIEKIYKNETLSITKVVSEGILNSDYSFIMTYDSFIKQDVKNGDCLILNEISESLKNEEITNLIIKAVNNFGYIIISSKSENHPYDTYRSKNELLYLLNDFDIIQETYYGNPEFRLAEKEYFLIIIRGNADPSKEPGFVTWEGSQFFYNSLAAINRELELKILESPDFELSIIVQDYYREVSFENYEYYELLKKQFGKILLKKTDFHIRHSLPSDFSSPDYGYYIMIIPWEFGKLPEPLVKHINQLNDRLWCPSNYVKELHIKSGILPDKIRVIPNGLNPEIFNPEIKPITINTKKTFRFLFLGGIIYRKGIDVLIEAYSEEFTREEDVSLVIKGLGQNTYYYQDLILNKIHDLKDNDKNPEIVFMENNFAISEMGSIYTSCDCYVHPYRGEGFCMPVAEAMACGLPVIVTNYGPSFDFCTSKNSYLLDYELKNVSDTQSNNSFIVSEPDKNHLRKLMRHVFENRTEAKAKGKKASNDVLSKLSWEKVFELIQDDFNELKKEPLFRKSIQQRIKDLMESFDKVLNIDDYSQAKRIIDELEKIVSDKKPFFEFFGYAYNKIGNHKKSIEYYMELLKLNPKNTETREIISGILLEIGDKKTAQLIRKIDN